MSSNNSRAASRTRRLPPLSPKVAPLWSFQTPSPSAAALPGAQGHKSAASGGRLVKGSIGNTKVARLRQIIQTRVMNSSDMVITGE